MIRSLLVLELNELSPTLLERFMAAGDLPGFSQLRDESLRYVTDPEEPQGFLNPWIQWVTVHTGVGYDDHNVFKLGEGASLVQPTVADLVTSAGGTVWLCGPMNVVPTGPVRGRWLPDPWNPAGVADDDDLAPFAEFVRANVQEHTNAQHRMSSMDHLRFVVFMARHGLSPASVVAAARQLFGERTGRSHRWQRAALLDRFQWDLFRSIYRRNRPTFATYFSNTTAHFQHLYWRHMDPEPFTIKPTVEEVTIFGDAVRQGYREMDRIVTQAMQLAGDETTLVFCSALSQQPYLLKEDEGGSRFHRPNDINDLVTRLELGGVTQVAPVMSAQFHLYFRDEPAAEVAAHHLGMARVDGRPAFDVRRVGSDVFTGCSIMTDIPPDAILEVPGTGVRLRFRDHFYRAETAKSGYHHPHGALWIRTLGRHGATFPTPVPLRAVAPTWLRLMGLKVPASMPVPPLSIDATDLTSA